MQSVRKLLIAKFILCSCVLFIKAVDNLRSPDVRALGMGGNGVTHSLLFNPSLLPLRMQKELQIDYYNRYSLKELATISGGFCFPNDVLPFGIHAASFGYDEYRESMFRFSVGKRLNAWCALGVGAQYVVFQSDLFESDVSRLSTDIGLTLYPVENWLIALSIINFPTVSLSNEEVDSEHMMPLLMEAGFNWQFINSLLITGGVTYCKNASFSGSLGMEYVPYTDFLLRAGVKTGPFCPSFGIGYQFSSLTTDVVMIYHPVLGISTGVGLSFSF